MEWTILLAVGYWLRKDSHPYHCIRLRTSAYLLASFLFRLEHDDLALPTRRIHVFLQT